MKPCVESDFGFGFEINPCVGSDFGSGFGMKPWVGSDFGCGFEINPWVGSDFGCGFGMKPRELRLGRAGDAQGGTVGAVTPRDVPDIRDRSLSRFFPAGKTPGTARLGFDGPR